MKPLAIDLFCGLKPSLLLLLIASLSFSMTWHPRPRFYEVTYRITYDFGRDSDNVRYQVVYAEWRTYQERGR